MAITTIHGRQLRIGTVSQDRIDAAFQAYLDGLENSITSLGSAFNYVKTIAGGADEANAVDLALEDPSDKDTGDYYKVSASGWFKVDTGDAFYANTGDGLVWNLIGGVDVIDNTNSDVSGTTDFVDVTGSTDTGFVVDLAQAFKDRLTAVETLAAANETNIGDLSTLTTTEKGTVVGSINELDAEIGDLSTLTTDEKGTVVGALNEVDAHADAVDTKVGDLSSLSTTDQTSIVNAINEVQSEIDNMNPGTQWVRVKVGAAGVTGVIDNSNLDFVLTAKPTENTLQVYLNGVLQELADDYTYDAGTQTVSMIGPPAPQIGDKITFTYFQDNS